MHRSPSQIERELNELKFKLQNQAPLPSIPALEALVQKWTSRTVLDPIHRPDLYDATKALEAAQEVWAQRAKDNTTLSNLTRELDESIAQRRIEAARQADEQLQQAISEYQHACLIAARALRKVLHAQRQSSNVPGAQHNISALRVGGFNIPHLFGISNQGTLGSAMQQGLQAFESPPQADNGLRRVA
jgi:hypothetical protein